MYQLRDLSMSVRHRSRVGVGKQKKMLHMTMIEWACADTFVYSVHVQCTLYIDNEAQCNAVTLTVQMSALVVESSRGLSKQVHRMHTNLVMLMGLGKVCGGEGKNGT